jgi:hypothetical protein
MFVKQPTPGSADVKPAARSNLAQRLPNLPWHPLPRESVQTSVTDVMEVTDIDGALVPAAHFGPIQETWFVNPTLTPFKRSSKPLRSYSGVSIFQSVVHPIC